MKKKEWNNHTTRLNNRIVKLTEVTCCLRARRSQYDSSSTERRVWKKQAEVQLSISYMKQKYWYHIWHKTCKVVSFILHQSITLISLNLTIHYFASDRYCIFIRGIFEDTVKFWLFGGTEGDKFQRKSKTTHKLRSLSNNH